MLAARHRRCEHCLSKEVGRCVGSCPELRAWAFISGNQVLKVRDDFTMPACYSADQPRSARTPYIPNATEDLVASTMPWLRFMQGHRQLLPSHRLLGRSGQRMKQTGDPVPLPGLNEPHVLGGPAKLWHPPICARCCKPSGTK